MSTNPTTLLFDFGDTLFEPLPEQYSTSNLLSAMRAARVTNSEREIQLLFKQAKQATAKSLAHVSFYRHTDYIAEAFQNCCQKLGKAVSADVALAYARTQRDAVIANLQPRHDCKPTLRTFRERGYRLGIVSNIDNDWLSPLIEKWHIDGWVDTILTSETAQSCKPDSKIFLLACEQHQCNPNEVVFIGDDEVNDVFGASELGMATILLTNTNLNSKATHVVRSLDALLSIDTLL